MFAEENNEHARAATHPLTRQHPTVRIGAPAQQEHAVASLHSVTTDAGG
jgi:hypothetical protein